MLLHLLYAVGFAFWLPVGGTLAALDAESFEVRLRAQRTLRADPPYVALAYHRATTESPESAYQVGELLAEGQRALRRFWDRPAPDRVWDEVADALIDAPGERDGLPLASKWAGDWSWSEGRVRAALYRRGSTRGLIPAGSEYGPEGAYYASDLDSLRFRARGLPGLGEWSYRPLGLWQTPLRLLYWLRKYYDPRPLLRR